MRIRVSGVGRGIVVLYAWRRSTVDSSPLNEMEHETRPKLAESAANPFVHRRNSDHSYDSICTRCLVTVAKANIEADLEKAEFDHVCAGFDLSGTLRPKKPR